MPGLHGDLASFSRPPLKTSLYHGVRQDDSRFGNRKTFMRRILLSALPACYSSDNGKLRSFDGIQV